jgi:hypothetical protein
LDHITFHQISGKQLAICPFLCSFSAHPSTKLYCSARSRSNPCIEPFLCAYTSIKSNME